jgi:hypothetical protein
MMFMGGGESIPRVFPSNDGISIQWLTNTSPIFLRPRLLAVHSHHGSWELKRRSEVIASDVVRNCVDIFAELLCYEIHRLVGSRFDRKVII